VQASSCQINCYGSRLTGGLLASGIEHGLKLLITSFPKNGQLSGGLKVGGSAGVMIVLILIVLFLVAIAFWGSAFLMKRALRSVIRSFRDNAAITPETAKIPTELGFKNRGLFQIGTFRDYKPVVLQSLQKEGIILATDDDRLYLSETKLLESGIERRFQGRK
jgi:hypothetical protein